VGGGDYKDPAQFLTPGIAIFMVRQRSVRAQASPRIQTRQKHTILHSQYRRSARYRFQQAREFSAAGITGV
jgi:hypothetical protein